MIFTHSLKIYSPDLNISKTLKEHNIPSDNMPFGEETWGSHMAWMREAIESTTSRHLELSCDAWVAWQLDSRGSHRLFKW